MGKNGKRHLAVKWLTAVMMLILVWGQASIAFAADAGAAGPDASGTGTVPTMKFPDVKAGHWAEKSIAELSLLGVIHGYTDGTFKPDKTVKKEEAAVLIDLFASLQVDTSKDPVLPLIADKYARSYIDAAIKNHFINVSEETSAPWGPSGASRQWVAKLIVRAIGKQSAADAAAGQPTSFTDDGKISAADKPYVKVASDLKIISGMPDGSFNPTGDVTRAEIAVMLAKAESYLSSPSPDLTTGALLSLSNGTIQLQEKGGKLDTYPVAANALFYSYDSNKEIQPIDIQTYDEISVVHPNGTAYYVELIKDQPQYQSVTGVLKSKSTSPLQLTVTVNGTDKVYPYSSSVAVTNQDGSGMRLSDLMPGTPVQLQVNTFGATPTVEGIQVTGAAAGTGVTGTSGAGGTGSNGTGGSQGAGASQTPTVAEVSGQVAFVDASTNQVMVKPDNGGAVQSFTIPDSVQISSANGNVTLSSLQSGDKVQVTTKDSVVTAFTLISRGANVVNGKVELVKDGVLYIQKSDDNTHVGYNLTDSTKVDIDGMPQATPQDLLTGDQVQITLSGPQTVASIKVFNRNIHVGFGYKVDKYNATTNQILLESPNSQGDWTLFQLSDQTTLEYMGNPVKLADMTNKFPEGQRVDIKYSDSGNQGQKQLLSMSVNLYYDGTIQSVDTLNKKIQIDTSDFGSVTFNYSLPLWVDMFTKSNAAVSDLKPGQTVRVTMNPNADDMINNIAVEQHVVATITGLTSSKLSIAADVGQTYDFYNLSSTPINTPDGRSVYQTNLQQGDRIVLDVTGHNLNSIIVPTTISGTVTGIDTEKGEFTVKGLDGASHTLQAGPMFVVKKGDTSYWSMASLTVGDKVSVTEENTTHNHFVEVETPMTKTFFKYLGDSNSVQFYHAYNDSSKYVYPLANNVYLHQGDTPLKIDSFQQDDHVKIYVSNGVIVDMERLAN